MADPSGSKGVSNTHAVLLDCLNFHFRNEGKKIKTCFFAIDGLALARSYPHSAATAHF